MIDVQELKIKLYNKLKDSGWANVLKTFMLSQDFDNILLKLINLTENDKRFTPPLKTVFRAFEECPYEKLKVVMICPDPFNAFGIANGIAFSCPDSMQELGTATFLKGIQSTVYVGQDYVWEKDLKRLSNQGVLLINVPFTVTIEMVGNHYPIWRLFIEFLLDTLNTKNKDAVYVFVGYPTKKLIPYITNSPHKLTVNNPLTAAFGKMEWNCDDIFNKINKILKEQNKEEIVW